MAEFDGLSVQKAAGEGYRLSFFLVGSEKECALGALRQECEEWASHRNNGGIGGYHVELLGPELTLVPDTLVLTPFGDREPPWRIGEVMKAYRVTAYDSTDMTSPRAEISAADINLAIKVSLYSSSGVDVTASLDGTTIQTFSAGIAEFDDLIVSDVVGTSFTLVFSASWRDRCLRKLIDETCSGQCCIKVSSVDIFPQQMLVGHPHTVPLATEGGVIANFSVLFTDFSGNVLTQVGADFGLQAHAHLSQRGTLLAEKLSGQTISDVISGVATFTDLSIYEHAGRDVSIFFSDRTSQISATSAQFDVYPRSIYFDGILEDAVTGGPIETAGTSSQLTIKLLSTHGKVLSAVSALDNFTIEVHAVSSIGGSWHDCECLLGPNTALAADGLAIFSASLLSIPSAVGKFALQFKLQRAGLPPLVAQSNAFNVKPQGIYIKSSSLLAETIVGDVLGMVALGFQDDFGMPINNTGDLSTGSFQAMLIQDSATLATHHLSGSTSSGVVLGGASFGDLRVQRFVGASLRLKFVFTSINGNETTIFELLSSAFIVRPARFSINNTLPNSVTDLSMPTLNVSILDNEQRPLLMARLEDDIEVAIELHTIRYLGCSSLSVHGTDYASVTWEQCARFAVASNAPYFVTGRNSTPGTGFCGIVSNASLLPANLGCAVGCEHDPGGCSPSSSNRLYYRTANSTALLIGDRKKTVNGGSVIFSGLRITGLYGVNSSIIAVRNRGSLRDVVVTSHAFTVDPVAWKITGLPNTSHVLSQPLPTTNIAVTDLNGHIVECVFANDAHVVETTLMHAGVEVNHRLGLPHSRTMPTSSLSFAFRFFETGGSNFTLKLSMQMQGYNSSLSLESTHFIIYPDQLILVGPQGAAFDGYSDTVLQTLQIRCKDLNGTLLTDIQPRDYLQVLLGAVDTDNEAIAACSGLTTTGCVGGSDHVTVSNGTAVFNNISIVGYSGANIRLNFRILGGGPAPVFSPIFNLFANALYITQGEYKFSGVQWIINRGMGDYSVSLIGAAGEPVPVSSREGYIVTATLRQEGTVDLTSALNGTRVQIANHSQESSTTATFTDLVVTEATGMLTLHFTVSHPNSSLILTNSTKKFMAVPYALRIAQKCFNGRSVGDNINAVPYGLPLLQCIGPGALASDLGRDFGRFGYLTGYYRYENNQNLGPLLVNARGIARVPPIDVLATDLYLKVQTLIKPTHSFKINLRLFVGDQQYTSHVTGSTSQVMADGVATFQDLSISSIPRCKPNCTLLFLFNFEGVLCSDTWCTNVTMDLRDAPIVAPHRLGSHPAFPGISHIEGTISVPCVTASEYIQNDDQNVLRHALLAASAVPYLTLDSIELEDPPAAVPPGPPPVHIPFKIRAQSDVAASSLMSTVTDQFREGTQIIKEVCTRLEKNHSICAQCVETPKLDGKLNRAVLSYLWTDTVKLPSPKFSPPGLPEGSCLRGEWVPSSGTCVVPFGPFQEFYLDLTIVDGTSYQKRIYYTVDTCPIATPFCNTTGSIPTDQNTISDKISDSGFSPLTLPIFTTSPTQALTGLPDGLFNNEFQGFFSDDRVKPELEASVLAGFHRTLVDSGRHIGIREIRQTSVMPEFLTIRAFGKYRQGNHKAPSFPTSTTFRLSPQASTPKVDWENAKLWVLGWCNETHSSYPKARVGDEFIRTGSCADIQHANDSSVCSGAGEVPCRLSSAEAFCTAGSKASTLSEENVLRYDGVLVRASATTTLSEPFNGLQDTRMRVESVSALGFTNDGELVHPRTLYVSCPNGGCNEGLFTVLSVRQDDNSLEVQYLHEFSYAAGMVVSLNDTCTASLAHQTLILPISTETAGSSIYFNIPGTDPTITSHILGPANSLTIDVSRDTSLRAVSVGENMMNSPYLHLDLTQPCGNGVINGGEQCDDGNLIDGDLCSSRCMFERKCEDAIWQSVTHENIGITYRDSGENHSRPDALIVSQRAGNGTGLLSDCTGFLIVSQVHEFMAGGFRQYDSETTDSRFSDSGCTASIGTEVLMAGDYRHSIRTDGNGNPVLGLENVYSFDVESEVFSKEKYKFSHPKNAMACLGVGYKAYFAGGLAIDDAGTAYDMLDEVDELEVNPPAEEGLESTHVWTYKKWKLSAARTYVGTANIGNLIAFGGGIDLNTYQVFANVDLLDTETGQMNVTYMPMQRYLHAMTAVGPYILLAGGVNELGYLKSVERFDTRYRNFTSFPDGLVRPRALLAAAATSTKAFFAGGFDGQARSDVDVFDLDTDSFYQITPLQEARYSLIGVTVKEGQDIAIFGGGRRRDGLSPTGSKMIDIYDGPSGNHSYREMISPRMFHFGGSAKQYVLFGLGLPSDPGFQNVLSWLGAEPVLSVDVFDVSIEKIIVRANITATSSAGVSSKKVTLPYYHLPTRVEVNMPIGTTSSYDESDLWRITCEPGFRKTRYQIYPETPIYSSFVCVCTNVTNFFHKPSLYPSDQAVSMSLLVLPSPLHKCWLISAVILRTAVCC